MGLIDYTEPLDYHVKRPRARLETASLRTPFDSAPHRLEDGKQELLSPVLPPAPVEPALQTPLAHTQQPTAGGLVSTLGSPAILRMQRPLFRPRHAKSLNFARWSLSFWAILSRLLSLAPGMNASPDSSRTPPAPVPACEHPFSEILLPPFQHFTIFRRRSLIRIFRIAVDSSGLKPSPQEVAFCFRGSFHVFRMG